MAADPGRLDICIVAAMTADRVIGKGGKMPWYIPSDLRRFKELTTGHSVVMGYTTFAIDLRGKPLPNRTNYVLTRQHADEVRVAGATPIDKMFDGAVSTWASGKECFVIGGAQVYAEVLQFADRMNLTMVNAHIQGDARFPAVNWAQWRRVSEPSVARRHDPKDEFETSYIEYERIRN